MSRLPQVDVQKVERILSHPKTITHRSRLIPVIRTSTMVVVIDPLQRAPRSVHSPSVPTYGFADNGSKSGSSDTNESFPPDESFRENYTYSAPTSESGPQHPMRIPSDCHTPQSSPTVPLVDSPTVVDMLACLPRGEDHTLKMDQVRALFPHLSEDELEKLLPTCETYRNKAYFPVRESDEDEN